MNNFNLAIAASTLCGFLLISCSDANRSGKSIQNAAITQTYPELYEAVYSREAEKISPFTDHSSSFISRQAWRGLVQTPVDSMEGFIGKIKQDSSSLAWFALSLHELNTEQLRNIETFWLDNSESRAGASLVLGRQGDEKTLSFLLAHVDDIAGSGYEQEFALAVGRLMVQFPVKSEQQRKIVKAAFSADQPKTTRSWLYGFYRGEVQQSDAVTKEILYEQWKTYGIGKSAKVDQYVTKILAPDVFAEIVNYYDSTGHLYDEVQLSIELAQTFSSEKLSDENKKAVQKLLLHPNVHVVHQMLASLTTNAAAGDSLLLFIKSELIENSETESFVWMQALETVKLPWYEIISQHEQRVEQILQEQPYRVPQVLDLWMKNADARSFLQRIEYIVDSEKQLQTLFAIQALNEFWSDAQNKEEIKNRVRQIVFDALALHDRGITFASMGLLDDSLLFTSSDFERINKNLHAFTLPGDIEVYQAFGRLYKNRFEAQSHTVIDSLAALGYAPLNRSLKQAGWDVEVSDDYKPEFRKPDWERLWELGKHPVWVLETEKGTIKIKMNTLSVPATISAIDSLTRAGAYNGVPFHRVVPNFVIQGGDITRQDGFGGPDFIIPTEPNEQGFTRGAVGIASAGTDTEGSQYFIMHQWSPHLNGRYTLFGNVIEGMDVVDRMVEGDKVVKAYWDL